MTGITRIAPTPSGFLHLGNLVNFRLIELVARELNLQILLRIDDADAGRLREQYTSDIFRALAFLGIKPDLQAQSQLDRTAIYWSALKQIADKDAQIFVCTCSRTQMPNRKCTKGCARTINEFNADSGEDRIRMHYVDSAGNHEDITLWGREHPSYHLVTCVDDRDYGVTHVVRGADLAPSTEIHKVLNSHLGHAVKFAHHELLLDLQGNKLSKSQGTNQLQLNSQLLADLNHQANRLVSSVLSQFD